MKPYQKVGLGLEVLSCIPVLVGMNREDPSSIWAGVILAGGGLVVIVLGKFGWLR